MNGKTGSRMLMIGSDRAVVAGKQGAFWNTLSRLHEYWDRIDVICPHVRDPARLTVFGNVHFHPLPRGGILDSINVFRQGREICRSNHPDLVVAHSYGLQRMAVGGLLLARSSGLPLVVEVHHIDGYPKSAQARDRLRRRASLLFLRAAAKHAEAFRVTNRAELVPILRSVGVEEERILPLDAVYLDRSVFRPEPVVTKTFDLVFVGRLVPNKGLPMLLDAFERIKQERVDATFLIVGQGPLERWLHRHLARRGIQGVHHIPWVQTSELGNLYRRSRVVVCASSAEGGPRFVVEAMACGLPAVSTPVGLMNEVIQDRKNGYLLKSWSSAELSSAALALLGDEDLYNRCAAMAPRTVERFEASLTTERYANAYLQIATQCKS